MTTLKEIHLGNNQTISVNGIQALYVDDEGNFYDKDKNLIATIHWEQRQEVSRVGDTISFTAPSKYTESDETA